MTDPCRPLTIVSAAATQPADLGLREAFSRTIVDMPSVDGLEVNVENVTWREDRSWLEPLLASTGTHVVSLVGAMVDRRTEGVGLAAVGGSGRNDAIELLRKTRELVYRTADSGPGRIGYVVVQSAPHQVDVIAATRMLQKSLEEVVAWDWHGATILLEHCDAPQPGRAPAKGYLPIDVEIDVLDRLDHPSTGLVLNWGRCAIEGRSATTPDEFARRAREAGRLRGVVLSGVTPMNDHYGSSWADTHAPFADGPRDASEPASLLTSATAKSFLAAAGEDLHFRGVKLSLQGSRVTTETRASAIEHALTRIRDDPPCSDTQEEPL